MEEIYFDPDEVSATVNSLSLAYNNIENKISEINGFAKDINDFWISKEAELFIAQLENVKKLFVNFDDKYSNFLSVLDNAFNVYDEENKSLVEAINKLKKE